MAPSDELYLGDGLYASFDGWAIKLRAPREDGDHIVYLEADLYQALRDYASRCWRVDGGSDGESPSRFPNYDDAPPTRTTAARFGTRKPKVEDSQMTSEPFGWARWERGATRLFATKPVPTVDDVTSLVQDEVCTFGIDIEKQLCGLLGWEWRPMGQSIDTCMEALRRMEDRARRVLAERDTEQQ